MYGIVLASSFKESFNSRHVTRKQVLWSSQTEPPMVKTYNCFKLLQKPTSLFSSHPTHCDIPYVPHSPLSKLTFFVAFSHSQCAAFSHLPRLELPPAAHTTSTFLHIPALFLSLSLSVSNSLQIHQDVLPCIRIRRVNSGELSSKPSSEFRTSESNHQMEQMTDLHNYK